jgi:hypothetical protein
MKQLLAILFCACLLVPEAARIIASTYCSYVIVDKDEAPVCACTFNNIPADMQQTSLPDRHKEIVQQTEWQYLASENFTCRLSLLENNRQCFSLFSISYNSSYCKGIFHPPCFS